MSVSSAVSPSFVLLYICISVSVRKTGWLSRATKYSNWIRLRGMRSRWLDKRISIIKEINQLWKRFHVWLWTGPERCRFRLFCPFECFSWKSLKKRNWYNLPAGAWADGIVENRSYQGDPEYAGSKKPNFQVRYNRDWNMDDVNENVSELRKAFVLVSPQLTDPIPVCWIRWSCCVKKELESVLQQAIHRRWWKWFVPMRQLKAMWWITWLLRMMFPPASCPVYDL